MNERISELYEQATQWASEEENPVRSYKDRVMLKFAELIVQDCVKIVEGYCETTPEIFGLPLDILEHFDMEIEDDESN